jgi:hypothetical protein
MLSHDPQLQCNLQLRVGQPLHFRHKLRRWLHRCLHADR